VCAAALAVWPCCVSLVFSGSLKLF
jgi:hypothetical protein